MKNKLKSLNFILAVLLVLVLGTGCGRQKAIELPTSDETVVAASEAAAITAAMETAVNFVILFIIFSILPPFTGRHEQC